MWIYVKYVVAGLVGGIIGCTVALLIINRCLHCAACLCPTLRPKNSSIYPG
jgi:hypothetical protein